VPVERIWIAGNRGRVGYGARDNGGDYRHDLTKLAILAAGRVATDRAGLVADDAEDWRDAQIITRSNYDSHDMLVEAKFIARNILGRHWSQVEAIAARLRVGDLGSLEAAQVVAAMNMPPNPLTKSPGEIGRVKKQQAGAGPKKLADTDDVAELDGEENLPAEDAEDDENELTDEDAELAKKQKGVFKDGRMIGFVAPKGEQFVALLIRGRRHVRIGRFRSSDAAARAI
jgi:hypothetical protein